MSSYAFLPFLTVPRFDSEECDPQHVTHTTIFYLHHIAGQSFESPSAFSIRVKRKLNPERKADDGWKAVKYAGK